MYGQGLPKSKSVATPANDDDREVSLDEWDDIVADHYRVPKNLMKAMAGQESGGDIKAVSPTGVRGRYQVTEQVARGYGLDRNNPFQQSVAAARYLRDQYDAINDVQDDDERWLGAVGRYYGGPSAVSNGELSSESVDNLSNPADHVRKVAEKWGTLNRGQAGPGAPVEEEFIELSERGLAGPPVQPPAPSSASPANRTPIEKPANRLVREKPLSAIEQRNKRAAQIIREIESRRDRAVRLFKQADRQASSPPAMAIAQKRTLGSTGTPIGEAERLRAMAEGELETANRLADDASKSYGDLIEVGFGKDADPRSDRRWAYAKAKRAPGTIYTKPDTVFEKLKGLFGFESPAYDQNGKPLGVERQVMVPNIGVQMYLNPTVEDELAAESTPEDIERTIAQQKRIQAEKNRLSRRSAIGQAWEGVRAGAKDTYLGDRYEVTPEDRARAAENRAATGRSFQGDAGTPTGGREALGQLARAGGSILAAIPRGAAEFADTVPAYTVGMPREEREKNSLTKAIQPYTDPLERAVKAASPIDPNDDSWLTAKIPAGIGSALGFMGGGALARAAGIPSAVAGGLIGGASQIAQTAEEMDKAGIDPKRRDAAILVAGAQGLTEMFGLGGFLDKFGLKRQFMQRAVDVLEEGGQEALQQYIGNINAVLVGQYDKNRSLNPLSRDVLEAAVLGGIVGGFFQGADLAAGAAGKLKAVITKKQENGRPVVKADDLLRGPNGGQGGASPPQPVTEPLSPPPGIIPSQPATAPLSPAPAAPAGLAPEQPNLAPAPVGETATPPAPVEPATPAQPPAEPGSVAAIIQQMMANRAASAKPTPEQQRAEREAKKAEERAQKEAGIEAERGQRYENFRIQAEDSATKAKTLIDDGDFTGGIAELGVQRDALQQSIANLPKTPQAVQTRAELQRQMGTLDAQIKEYRRQEAQARKTGVRPGAANVTEDLTDGAGARSTGRLPGVEETFRANYNDAKNQASLFEDEGRYEDAVRELDAAFDNLKRLRNLPKYRSPKTAEDADKRDLLIREISLVAGERGRLMTRYKAEQARLRKTPKSLDQIRSEPRDPAVTRPLPRQEQAGGSGLSPLTETGPQPGPLLRSIVNPEGGIPESYQDPNQLYLPPNRGKKGDSGEKYDNVRLIARIRQLGGINPGGVYTGDLQGAIDKRLPGMINRKDGYGPDDMLAMLADEGYNVDREDLNSLFDAIDRDIRNANEFPLTRSRTEELEEGMSEYYENLETGDLAQEEAEEAIAEQPKRPTTKRLMLPREATERLEGRTEEDAAPSEAKAPPEQEEGAPAPAGRTIREQMEDFRDEIDPDDLAALERALANVDREDPREYGDRTRPGQPGSGLSYSPYAVIVANNREQVKALYETPLNSEEGQGLIDTIREYAVRNNIPLRHVHNMLNYIRGWQMQNARLQDMGIDPDEFRALEWDDLQNSIEYLKEEEPKASAKLPDIARRQLGTTELGRLFEAGQDIDSLLLTLHEEPDMMELFEQAVAGDEQAYQFFEDGAVNEYGYAIDTVRYLVESRRAADEIINRRNRADEGRGGRAANAPAAPAGPGNNRRTGRTTPISSEARLGPRDFALLNTDPVTLPDSEFDDVLVAIESLRNKGIVGPFAGGIELTRGQEKWIRDVIGKFSDERHERVMAKRLSPRDPEPWVPTIGQRQARREYAETIKELPEAERRERMREFKAKQKEEVGGRPARKLTKEELADPNIDVEAAQRSDVPLRPGFKPREITHDQYARMKSLGYTKAEANDLGRGLVEKYISEGRRNPKKAVPQAEVAPPQETPPAPEPAPPARRTSTGQLSAAFDREFEALSGDQTVTAEAEGQKAPSVSGFDREAAITEILESARKPLPNIVERDGGFAFTDKYGVAQGQREKTREELIARFEQGQKNDLFDYRRRLNQMSDAEIDERLGRIRENQKRIEDAKQEAAEIGASEQRGGKRRKKGKAETVRHPDPAIDGKPVIEKLDDGRVVVENPENISGVSVVKDRSDEERDYDSSSTQVNLPKEVADTVREFAKRIPENALADKGREDEPHITVKYGLKGSRAGEVRKILEGSGPIRAKLGKVSLFTTNPDFDVIKIEVESDDLQHLHRQLAEAVPNEEKFPEYNPHVTIAYVKKGEGAKYAGYRGFAGQTLNFDKVQFSGWAGNKENIPVIGETAETPAAKEATAPAPTPFKLSHQRTFDEYRDAIRKTRPGMTDEQIRQQHNRVVMDAVNAGATVPTEVWDSVPYELYQGMKIRADIVPEGYQHPGEKAEANVENEVSQPGLEGIPRANVEYIQRLIDQGYTEFEPASENNGSYNSLTNPATGQRKTLTGYDIRAAEVLTRSQNAKPSASVVGQTIEHRDAHISGGEVIAESADGTQAVVKTPDGGIVTIKHPDRNQAVKKPESANEPKQFESKVKIVDGFTFKAITDGKKVFVTMARAQEDWVGSAPLSDVEGTVAFGRRVLEGMRFGRKMTPERTDRFASTIADVAREVQKLYQDAQPAKPAAPAQPANTGQLSDLFDSAFNEMAADEAPAEKTPRAPRTPKQPAQPRKPRTEAKPAMEAKPPERTAGEAIVSAKENVKKGISGVLKGLGELFGGGNKLTSGGLAFDEETYAKAKPLFEQAYAHFRESAKDIDEAMRLLLRALRGAGYGMDVIQGMKPYIMRFIAEEQARGFGQPQATAVPSQQPAEIEQPVQPQENAPSRESRPTRKNEQGGQAGLFDGGQDEQTDAVGTGQSGLPGGRTTGSVREDAGGRDTGSARESDRGRGERVSGADDRGRGGSVERPGDSNGIAEGTVRAAEVADAITSSEDIVVATEEKAAEADPSRVPSQQPSSTMRAPDFSYESAESISPGGKKTKLKANFAAIRLLRNIQAEGRTATREEQEVLSRFTGWGQFPEVFNEFNESGEKWDAERAELKELLGNEEDYEKARRSTQYAHYTSPGIVEQMWEMVRGLGFRGGRVLENSMGVGYFFGLMPKDLRSNSQMTGVEMEPTPAGIAKLLYPSANIQNKKFEDFKIPDGFYDVVIGNVPFSNEVKPYDRKYSKYRANLHDYFILKSLDTVREGGIVAVITSTGTMDKKDSWIREAFDKKADLVAAMRFPEGSHQKNAGTQVVTDLLIFRKRKEGEAKGPNRFTNLSEAPDADGGAPIAINEYFVKNPQMILGRLDRKSRLYKKGEMNVSLTDDYDQRFQKAIASIPSDVMDTARASSAFDNVEIANSEELDGVPDGSFVDRGGKIMIRDGDTFTETTIPAADYERMKGLMGVRDALRGLIQAQMRDENTQAARDTLHRVYDRFARKFGALRKKTNAKAFSNDPSSFLVQALEKSYDSKTGKAQKADIFYKDVIYKQKRVENVQTPADAISASLFETGKVSLPRVAELLNVSEDEAAKQLSKSGLAFLNPNGTWETAEQYLSGTVRRKLVEAHEAAAADPRFQANVEALEKVQPPDIGAEDIYVKLGAPWVPASDIADFAASLLNAQPDNFRIIYSAATSTWSADYASSGSSVRGSQNAIEAYGTADKNFIDLLEAALNDRPVKVTRYDSVEKKSYVDEDATIAANAKSEEIKDAFQNWIWQEDERALRLHRYYNDNYNDIRVIEYKGEHYKNDQGKLILPGMNPMIELRPNQVKDIWQAVVNGKLLDASEVGAGKTFIMGGIAMEWRRLGLAKKPAIVVPKSRLTDTVKEIQLMYPAAKILSLIKGFTAAERKATTARIATGDYDIVVMSHEQLDKMPLSPAIANDYINEELREISEQIVEAKEIGGQEGNRIVKRLEAIVERLENKLKQVLEGANKDDAVFFEETGIDAILVDEAHAFKSLPVYSRRYEVKGIPQTRSDRATNMDMRVRWLYEQNRNRGVVFATGTPISNTMAELYNMQRYLQPEALEARGIKNFDAWVDVFADTDSKFEHKANGDFQPVTRLASFVNIPELRNLVGQIMATNFVDDMPWITRPKKVEQVITVPMSEAQIDFRKAIRTRVQALKTMSPAARKASGENYLVISTDARKSALSSGLVRAGAKDPGGKVEAAANKVLEIHKARPGVTQMIFSDMGINETPWKYSVYKELKTRLVEGGIPANKIVDFSKLSDNAKGEAAQKLKKGEYLVGIGSSWKMGTGVNAQDKLAAIHHIDAPWVPAFVEQRNGRGYRQGNTNPEIEIFYYTTQGSFDLVMWQAINRKWTFIQQFMRGDNDLRVINMDDVGGDDAAEDGPGAMSPEMIMAMTSENPYEMDFVRLRQDVERLKRMEKNHRSGETRIRNTISSARRRIPELQQENAEYDQDLAQLEKVKENPRPTVINGKPYEKRADAANQMVIAMAMAPANGAYKIGEYKGFELWANRHGNEDLDGRTSLYLKGKAEDYHAYVSDENVKDPISLFNSLDGKLKYISRSKEKNIERIEESGRDIEQAQARLGLPFKHAAKLDKAMREFSDVQRKMKGFIDKQNATQSQMTPANFAEMLGKVNVGAKDGAPVSTVMLRRDYLKRFADLADMNATVALMKNIGVIETEGNAGGLSDGNGDVASIKLTGDWTEKAAAFEARISDLAKQPLTVDTLQTLKEMIQSPKGEISIPALRRLTSRWFQSGTDFDAYLGKLADAEAVHLHKLYHGTDSYEKNLSELSLIEGEYHATFAFRPKWTSAAEKVAAPAAVKPVQTEAGYTPLDLGFSGTEGAAKSAAESETFAEARKQLVEAIRNAGAAAKKAFDGLYTTFNDRSKLGAGFVFDEQTYAKAKPLFAEAYTHLKQAAGNVAEATKLLIEYLKTEYGLTQHAVNGMRPYLDRYLKESGGRDEESRRLSSIGESIGKKVGRDLPDVIEDTYDNSIWSEEDFQKVALERLTTDEDIEISLAKEARKMIDRDTFLERLDLDGLWELTKRSLELDSDSEIQAAYDAYNANRPTLSTSPDSSLTDQFAGRVLRKVILPDTREPGYLEEFATKAELKKHLLESITGEDHQTFLARWMRRNIDKKAFFDNAITPRVRKMVQESNLDYLEKRLDDLEELAELNPDDKDIQGELRRTQARYEELVEDDGMSPKEKALYGDRETLQRHLDDESSRLGRKALKSPIAIKIWDDATKRALDLVDRYEKDEANKRRARIPDLTHEGKLLGEELDRLEKQETQNRDRIEALENSEDPDLALIDRYGEEVDRLLDEQIRVTDRLFEIDDEKHVLRGEIKDLAKDLNSIRSYVQGRRALDELGMDSDVDDLLDQIYDIRQAALDQFETRQMEGEVDNDAPVPASADKDSQSAFGRLFAAIKRKKSEAQNRSSDHEAAVEGIETRFRKAHNAPGLVSANRSGIAMIVAAAKEAKAPLGTGGVFWGSVYPNSLALKVADILEGNAPKYESGAKLKQLAKTLRDGVNDAESYGVSSVVIVRPLDKQLEGWRPFYRQLLTEERFHQEQISRGLHNSEIGPKLEAVLKDDPVYKHVKDQLVRVHKYKDTPALIVSEVSAQLAAGRWAFYGLPNEQLALDFLHRYFRAVARIAGPKALEVDFPGGPKVKEVQEDVRQIEGIERRPYPGSGYRRGTSRSGRSGDSGIVTPPAAGSLERGDGGRRGSGSEAQDGRNVPSPESTGADGPVGRFLKDEKGSARIDLGLGKLFSKTPPKTTPLRQIADMLGHERVQIDVDNLHEQTVDAILEAYQKGKYGTLPHARAYYWANKLGKTAIGKALGADTRTKKLEQRQAKYLNETLGFLTTISDNSTKMSQHQRGTRDYERAKRDMDQARVHLTNALSKLSEYNHPVTWGVKGTRASVLSSPHIPFFNIVQQAFQFPLHEAQRSIDFMVPVKVFEKHGIKYDKAPGDIRTWAPAMERELRAIRDGAASSGGDIVSMLRYGVSVSELNREFADEVEKTRGRRKSGSAIGTTDKYEMGNRPRLIPGLDQLIMMVGRVQGAADVLFTNITEATALAAAAEAEARRIAKDYPELKMDEKKIKELAADLAYEPSPAMAAAAGDVAARFRLDYPTWPYEALVKIKELEGIKKGGRHVEAVWKAAIDFVILFSKIPLAAVDTALFKYSPFGLVRTASRLQRSGKEFEESKRKGEAKYADPEFTQETVELYRQGLVGTATWILLGALGTLGYIGFTGGRDDDDERKKIDNAKEILNQPYRPEMTIGDTSFDIGKMGPVGQAAAVGARTAEAAKRRFDVKSGEYEPRSRQIGRTIGTAAKEVLMNNPVGAGLEDSLEALSSGSIERGASRMAQGKLRAVVPGAVREIARLTDDKRRQSDQTDFLSRVEGDVRSGIPGLRQGLQPRINALGEPVEETNPFSFFRTRRRDALLEDMIERGTGPSKPKRKDGESTADYNVRAIERGRQNVEAMNRLRGPETQKQTPEARRGMYDRALNPQQLTRSGKLSEQSIDAESQIEALRSDAVQMMTAMPEWQSMSSTEKAQAQKLIGEELRAFRARAGGQTRRGYRREREAVLPEWTPAELARAAISTARK